MGVLEILHFFKEIFGIFSSSLNFLIEWILSFFELIMGYGEILIEHSDFHVSTFNLSFKTINNELVMTDGFVDEHKELIHNWGADTGIGFSFGLGSLVPSAENLGGCVVFDPEVFCIFWEFWVRPSSEPCWRGVWWVTTENSWWSPSSIIVFVGSPVCWKWSTIFNCHTVPVFSLDDMTTEVTSPDTITSESVNFNG